SRLNQAIPNTLAQQTTWIFVIHQWYAGDERRFIILLREIVLFGGMRDDVHFLDIEREIKCFAQRKLFTHAANGDSAPHYGTNTQQKHHRRLETSNIKNHNFGGTKRAYSVIVLFTRGDGFGCED